MLVVADLGFESFRFRVFALRLRPSRYLLLHTAGSQVPKADGPNLVYVVCRSDAIFEDRPKSPRPGCAPEERPGWLSSGPAEGPCRGHSRLTGGRWPRMLKLPRAISRGIVASLRAIRQRILVMLARLLPPFDQPLAVGLAWLARIRMLFGSSRKQAGNELVHVIPSIGMGGVQRQLVLLLKNRSPDYNHCVVVLRSQDRFFAPELSECGVGVYYLDSEEVRSALALSPGTADTVWCASIVEGCDVVSSFLLRDHQAESVPAQP